MSIATFKVIEERGVHRTWPAIWYLHIPVRVQLGLVCKCHDCNYDESCQAFPGFLLCHPCQLTLEAESFCQDCLAFQLTMTSERYEFLAWLWSAWRGKFQILQKNVFMWAWHLYFPFSLRQAQWESVVFAPGLSFDDLQFHFAWCLSTSQFWLFRMICCFYFFFT